MSVSQYAFFSFFFYFALRFQVPSEVKAMRPGGIGSSASATSFRPISKDQVIREVGWASGFFGFLILKLKIFVF